MDFYAIESSLLCSFACFSIVRDNTGKLTGFQCTRSFMGLLTVRRMYVVFFNLDRRRCDVWFTTVKTGMRGAPTMPELKENYSASFMH